MTDDSNVVTFERRKINEWPKQVYLADFGDGDGCRPYGFIQRPDDTTPRYVRGDLHDAAEARIEELEAEAEGAAAIIASERAEVLALRRKLAKVISFVDFLDENYRHAFGDTARTKVRELHAELKGQGHDSP